MVIWFVYSYNAADAVGLDIVVGALTLTIHVTLCW